MKIDLVWIGHYGSDWVGIYLNGVKVFEGHPPEFDEALARLGIEHTDLTIPAEALASPGRRGLPDALPVEAVSR